MAEESEVRLEGFAELAAAMRELGQRAAKNALRRAVSSGAVLVRNEARANAPVDTGEMKKDIQVKREKDQRDGPLSAKYSVFVRSGKKSRLAGSGRNVDKDSFYWKFIEYGTSKMAAQPFMRPAFEAKKEDAVQAIGKVLDEAIQKAARELANR